MIQVLSEYHNGDLKKKLAEAWEKNQLTILNPPTRKDLSFVDQLEKQRDQLKKAIFGAWTSGTSSPGGRLVLFSKENILFSLEGIRELYETKRIKKIFCYPQPNHVFGLVLGYMHSILFGAELVGAEGPYSQKAHQLWMESVDENTLTLGTPTHLLDLVRAVQTQKFAAPRSYSSIVGGARSTQSLWQQMVDVLHIEKPSVGYGATEASPGVTHLPPGQYPAEDGDIGYALKGVQVSVDPEKGMTFRGLNTCLALLENSQLQFPKEITLNDSLKIEDDGRMTYCGRTDLIFNRGGQKLSLEHIEGLIASGLQCKCMALSFYDERLGEDFGLMIEGSVELSQIQEVLLKNFGTKVKEQNVLFAKIPVTENGKSNRLEAHRQMMRSWKWDLPVSVNLLRPLMPHRPPAIWVDEVVETGAGRGESRVILKAEANYMSHGRVRESSLIEFFAQGYGYILAFNEASGRHPVAVATRAMIIEVKDTKLKSADISKLVPGDELRIVCRCTHTFGPLSLLEGEIFHGENQLASINMKIYAGPA